MSPLRWMNFSRLLSFLQPRSTIWTIPSRKCCCRRSALGSNSVGTIHMRTTQSNNLVDLFIVGCKMPT
jgi:hypothetical protein